ncbi:hypothetical protein GW923_03550 [Candidatus Pacearchaeota archaeon]|nr:hypothetical protein [Candidatus Pacearchaeota archaeon]
MTRKPFEEQTFEEQTAEIEEGLRITQSSITKAYMISGDGLYDLNDQDVSEARAGILQI